MQINTSVKNKSKYIYIYNLNIQSMEKLQEGRRNKKKIEISGKGKHTMKRAIPRETERE